MKTVLNRNNVPVQERIMFLGPDLSIQRYDQFKYQKFYDLWVRQESYRWMPARIDLSKDRTDYENLNETERFIFESNIKFQTMTDSMLSRSIGKISQYVSNPELELCMGSWASMELIHSFSYTHIFKNVCKNATAFFDSILEDEEIVKRASSISESYDNLLNDDNADIKEKILNAIFCTNITEGISFYTSFICSFYFGFKGRLEGSAKIIGEIARDECLIEGTEVLTDKGWVQFKDLNIETHKVAQFNHDKTIEFVNASQKIEKEVDEKVLHFYNQKGYVDFVCTKNHRIPYQNRNGELCIKEADEVSIKTVYNSFLLAGKKKNGRDNLTMIERFLIAFQADGSFLQEEIRNGKITGCIAANFTFKKERKIKRFEEILKNLEFEYTKSDLDDRGQHKYYVKVPLAIKLSKKFDWVDLNDVSSEWCREFIEELSQWDGHLRYKDFSDIYYSTVVSYNADVVQSIACMAGYRCHRGIQVDNRKESYSDVHRLTILPNTDNVNVQCIIKEEVDYKGKVYCITVPSGMFVIRYNNRVSITGNCLHLSITQNIIKNWKKYPEEGFQELLGKSEDKIYAMFELGVQNEKNWVEYLFSRGSLLGLNTEIMHQYIEWLANTRLVSIGYKKLYKTMKNPVGGWSTRYFDSSSVQTANQETEAESYLLNAANAIIKDEDFEGIEL